jgi:hypothetical protein
MLSILLFDYQRSAMSYERSAGTGSALESLILGILGTLDNLGIFYD